MVIDPRVKRIVFAWIAVSACLMAVACGQKKSAAKHAPEPPRAAPSASGQRAAQAGAELDKDSGATAQERVATDADKSKDTSADTEAKTDAKADAKDGTSVDQAAKLARLDDEGAVRVIQFDVNEFNERERSRMQAGIAQDLVYTSSADDNLVALLKDRMNSVTDEAARQRNAEFAKQIGLTAVDFNWSSRSFRVTALLEREGKRAYHSFQGTLNNDLMGRFGGSASAPEIEGDLVCMDLNGGCRNVRVKFTEKKDGTERTAYVVVRDTPAWMYTKAKHPGDSMNLEFSRLAHIFFNTISNSGALNSVHSLNLTTSETVNGSATFVATMKMRVTHSRYRDGRMETLMWSGPLVKSASGAAVDIPVSNAVTVTRQGGVTVPVDPDNGYISDTIKRTRLIDNDGQGRLQMAITIRANQPNVQEETILLTVGGKRNQVKYKDL
ncbi:MAG: hypothetical protein NDI61_13150 [Bdellovibrionaceae bacterium]|nr:hypothetical protein [Pseudobdellovibrionaceae bacterium]